MQQLKGKLLPVAKPAAALEKVAITAEMKVRLFSAVGLLCFHIGCLRQGQHWLRAALQLPPKCCLPMQTNACTQMPISELHQLAISHALAALLAFVLPPPCRRRARTASCVWSG